MPNQGYPSHEERVQARRPALRHALSVRGPVREDQLGVVLPHEHILFDLRSQHEPFYPELSDRPITLDMLGRLRRHPATCKDNLIVDDLALARAELALFAQAGGGALVELSCRGTRLHLEALPQLAAETGVHIIAGTGLCGSPECLPDGDREDADALAARLARDVEQGLEGTAVRAGIIGEIAIQDPAAPGQALVLRAAARASQRTGAPIAVGCPPTGLAEVRRLLGEEQVPAEKVLLCGMDGAMGEDDRLRAADAGYYLLFDSFGQEYYLRGGEARVPRDPERLRALKTLIERGYLRQLLLAQGIDRKMFLTRYGGWGYGHIPRNVVPMMERERIAPKQITTMTMYNPARALAFL